MSEAQFIEIVGLAIKYYVSVNPAHEDFSDREYEAQNAAKFISKELRSAGISVPNLE